MFPLIAEWESSHHTRESFCQTKGLSLATFGYWRTRYLSARAEPAGFTEIKPEVSAHISITYPNGVRIEVPSSSMAIIGALVHLI